MNKLDKQYTDLLQDILDNGVTKSDRTGTGTISIFGRQIRHKMSDGFPLLTTKKMPFKTIVTELLWFLRGDTNIKFLVDNGCHIWDGDCHANFLKKSDGRPLPKDEFINKIKTDDEFAKKWGELGPIYGKQWRKWKQKDVLEWGYKEGEVLIDQIQNLINDLKTNPDSRRLMVNAWNVGELDQMTLPPCHYGFQVYTRELSQYERGVLYDKKHPVNTDDLKSEKDYNKSNIPTRAISLMWNQRSVDTFLGLPFNIASYGLLLEIIAKAVNMVPDELIGNLGDVHLYLNHIEQAKEQIGRELSWEERLKLVDYNKENFNSLDEWIEWFNQQPDNSVLHGVNYTKEEALTCLDVPTHSREPFPLPTLKHLRSDDKYTLLNEFPSLWDEFKISDFEMENYQSHPSIKAPLSN